MVSLLELKEFLKELDYPNINILSDEEVIETFSVENRRSFLTWFIRKLDPSVHLLHNCEESTNIMANIIYEYGFCTSLEKDSFVQGDNKLDASKQLEIFYRMLNSLSESEENKENSGSVTNTVNIEEIGEFVNMDVNLFPEYGPLKIRKPEDRAQKICNIEEEIMKVEKEIEILQNDEEISSDSYCDLNKKEEISTNFNSDLNEKEDISNALDEAILAFRNLSDFLGNRIDKDVDVPSFSNNFVETVANCDAKINTVADVVQSLSTISNISQNLGEKTVPKVIENLDMVTPLAELSKEIMQGTDETETNNSNTFS